MDGFSPGVGYAEGAWAGETMGARQVEGQMDGQSLGVGLEEGLLEGEILGGGRVGETSKGEREGAAHTDGMVEGDQEGARQTQAIRRRRRLRQHQRQARQKSCQKREGDQEQQAQQAKPTQNVESKETKVDLVEEAHDAWSGLQPPQLADGSRVNGDNKRQLKKENKEKRIEKQINQEPVSHWANHEGNFKMPPELSGIDKWEGEMCPSGLALHHPAAATLLEYATGGCPTNTGNSWTKQQMQEAIDRGPHVLALDPDAIAQMARKR
jgi:hypothetical protein